MDLTHRILKALGLTFWPPETGERYEYLLRCKNCAHAWYPRSHHPPRRCPKCQTRKWFLPAQQLLIDPPNLLPDPAEISPHPLAGENLETKNLRKDGDEQGEAEGKPSTAGDTPPSGDIPPRDRGVFIPEE